MNFNYVSHSNIIYYTFYQGKRAYSVMCFALIALLLLSCENHIIQRASSDYFPLDEGNWWRYTSANDTLFIEVEPLDTILNVECFPISADGYVTYRTKDDNGISDYINIVYNFSGETYTIIEDFIMRIELPLLDGNTFNDSLVDSLELSGEWVKAAYHVSGVVSVDEYSSGLYDGDVYRVEISVRETLMAIDTTIINDTYVEELYAPDIGVVQFLAGNSEYHLIAYHLN
ncbi:MAG: hypothetical protein JSV97_01260 [candidate division WOR-3 bacterium]|nr:MAG: hypothetical protein JSV97_01260 [candidate division WOR-3 bacterium]